MKTLQNIFTLMAMCCFTSMAYANSAPVAKTIAPDDQRVIVLELQKLLEENYVLEDKIPLYIDGLSQAVKAGRFDQTQSFDSFLDVTNAILQQSFPDRHLGVLSPEQYSRMEQMFGETQTGQDNHSAKDNHSGNTSHHGTGHAAQSSNDHGQGHAPSGGDAMQNLAGITRVAEINRDGLNQIGYIAFDRFIYSEKSKDIIQNIFQVFSESERIIIDLRECRGGDADFVKTLSSYFFVEPTHLVTSMRRGGEVNERWTTPNSLSPVFAQKKLDILISESTFSAAESFSFGLKRTGRARILGQPSGGGGHMNNFFPLSMGFGVSISVGRTYDPRTGEGWQATGIVPDLVFEKDHTLSETIAIITDESKKLDSFSGVQMKIYKLLQDYTHAWYNADADEMKNLISVDFEARYSSKGEVEIRNFPQQLIAAQDGVGVLPKLFHNRIIRNIVMTENKATAQLVLRETTHNIQLYQTDDGWKIKSDYYRDKVRHG